jgi:hypothetical protein
LGDYRQSAAQQLEQLLTGLLRLENDDWGAIPPALALSGSRPRDVEARLKP